MYIHMHIFNINNFCILFSYVLPTLRIHLLLKFMNLFFIVFQFHIEIQNQLTAQINNSLIC